MAIGSLKFALEPIRAFDRVELVVSEVLAPALNDIH